MKQYLLTSMARLQIPKTGIIRSVQHALAHFKVSRADDASAVLYRGHPCAIRLARFLRAIPPRLSLPCRNTANITRLQVFLKMPCTMALQICWQTCAGRPWFRFATSKPEPFALRILEHFGIADLFNHVAGAELDGLA